MLMSVQFVNETRHKLLPKPAFFSPYPYRNRFGKTSQMDFIEALPKSNEFDIVWMIVDRRSKHNHFIPLKDPFTVKDLAMVFVREIVMLHWVTRSIVLNRRGVSISSF